MIHRFSSRRQPLAASFIQVRRFEVAGEQLESLAGKIRVVCNSEIDQRDVSTVKAAQQALRKSWCVGKPEKPGYCL
jgi:hypothetical protein